MCVNICLLMHCMHKWMLTATPGDNKEVDHWEIKISCYKLCQMSENITDLRCQFLCINRELSHIMRSEHWDLTLVPFIGHINAPHFQKDVKQCREVIWTFPNDASVVGIVGSFFIEWEGGSFHRTLGFIRHMRFSCTIPTSFLIIALLYSHPLLCDSSHYVSSSR